MVAARLAAIALTTVIALPFVKTIWWRREKFATVIAQRVVKTIMPVPWIPLPEAQPPAISTARIPLFWHARMGTVVVHPGAIHSLIMTASPFVAILSLKWEKCVRTIVHRNAIHPMPVPSPN